ncbi:MAG: DMT family transporter [Betaproteobacteria bacterium]
MPPVSVEEPVRRGQAGVDHPDPWWQRPAVLFLTASLIWGSTWLAITYQLGHVATEASVAYRFALAAAILAAWCWVTRRPLRFPVAVHGLLAAQGALLFGLNYVAVYKAEENIASGLVAVLFSTIVFTSLVGTRLAFGVPITRRALAGAMLGVGGVALLFLPARDSVRAGGNAALGVAFGLAATLLATGGNLVSMRMQQARLPIMGTTAWGMAYGALFAAATAAGTGAAWTFDISAHYIGSLLYLAVFGSVVAFGSYLTLLSKVGAGPSSYVGVATPVLAMVLSTLLESYRWSWVGVLGVCLAVCGNVLVLRAPRRAGVERTATGLG